MNQGMHYLQNYMVNLFPSWFTFECKINIYVFCIQDVVKIEYSELWPSWADRRVFQVDLQEELGSTSKPDWSVAWTSETRRWVLLVCAFMPELFAHMAAASVWWRKGEAFNPKYKVTLTHSGGRIMLWGFTYWETSLGWKNKRLLSVWSHKHSTIDSLR